MRTKSSYATLCLLLVVGTCLSSPLAAAQVLEGGATTKSVNICGFGTCVHTVTSTEIVTQTQTCGGSGNTVLQIGDNNTANICNQNQTSG